MNKESLRHSPRSYHPELNRQLWLPGTSLDTQVKLVAKGNGPASVADILKYNCYVNNQFFSSMAEASSRKNSLVLNQNRFFTGSFEK